MAKALEEYILQNWILVLILIAFIIFLITTSFLDKKASKRLYFLLAEVFVLSITVFLEFYYENDSSFRTARTVLMAIRYSAAPILLANVIYATVKKIKILVFVPAVALTILDIVSIPTGVVFSINDENDLVRGPLGYLPFIIAGLYCAFLIYILVKRSNKRFIEIVPIALLALAFVSGLVFPFVFGPRFAQIYCPTIAVALFIYYVCSTISLVKKDALTGLLNISTISLVKKDALTGLLNRQAYYSETSRSFKDITAIVSMDMNGLKKINDTHGHAAGDEALSTLATCFKNACHVNQSAYRMGGDEFAIVCHKTSEEDVIKLIERIKEQVSKTKYTCSIGYSYQKGGHKELDDLLKVSDERMYANKAEYYKTHKE